MPSGLSAIPTNGSQPGKHLTDLRERKIAISTHVDEKGWICVHYEDNACGMNKETLARLFDPFFTTKDVGKGTGLGMSIAYSIMKRHKGRIEVISTPGHGSRFALYFPQAKKQMIPEADKGDEQQMLITTIPNTAILIVDDEKIVTELLRDYLGKEYQLEITNNTQEALLLIERKKYDLILTDLKMPKFSGNQIIQHAKKYQPDTPVMLMTGCSSKDEIMSNARHFPNVCILYKPFESPDYIKQLIQKTLSARNQKAA
ncbi:MAG: response regulator [Deltaproteobacteria bacterium]|nr:response regulator [Deltaproteobacteria bacterium]